jgi:uncharacterized Zn finger protein
MAQRWWSARFVQVLESYGLGARMQRGRRYARSGQVMSLDVSAGLLQAQVQGSRRAPYLVTVALATPTQQQWRAVDSALRARIGMAADLLAGEVPTQLEEVFEQARAPLFPRHWADLRARCSCPDSANPCKHVAAVLYVFADRLDDDPWLVLEWRGRSREQVLAAVGLAAADQQPQDALPPWWPLRPGDGPRPEDRAPLEGPILPAPRTPDAVLRRLESLDVTVWGEPLLDVLTGVYAAALSDEATDAAPLEDTNRRD